MRKLGFNSVAGTNSFGAPRFTNTVIQSPMAEPSAVSTAPKADTVESAAAAQSYLQANAPVINPRLASPDSKAPEATTTTETTAKTGGTKSNVKLYAGIGLGLAVLGTLAYFKFR